MSALNRKWFVPIIVTSQAGVDTERLIAATNGIAGLRQDHQEFMGSG
jgi:hypothetical protein